MIAVQIANLAEVTVTPTSITDTYEQGTGLYTNYEGKIKGESPLILRDEVIFDALCIGRGLVSAVGKSVISNVSKNTSKNGYRYMTEGEIKAIQETGMLRGGNAGETYFTKDLYKSASKAQQRLSLPSTPTHRVEFEILNTPTMKLNGSKVSPQFNMPGKGSEFMTTDQVKVRLINFQKLNK